MRRTSRLAREEDDDEDDEDEDDQAEAELKCSVQYTEPSSVKMQSTDTAQVK